MKLVSALTLALALSLGGAAFAAMADQDPKAPETRADQSEQAKQKAEQTEADTRRHQEQKARAQPAPHPAIVPEAQYFQELYGIE